MHHREIIINNVKREKGMADFLGHSNDLIILSLFLSQVPTYNSISFYVSPARACEYTAFLAIMQGRPQCF